MDPAEATRDRARSFVARALTVPPQDVGGLARDAASAPWSTVLREAGRPLHPLLGAAVVRLGLGVPPDVRATLDAAGRHAAIVALRRQSALHEALPALERAGLPPVVLKGFDVAHRFYDAPALRPMNDVDLWLPRGTLAKAAGVLGRLGWRPTWRGGSLAAQVAGGTLWLEHGTPPLLLEVHEAPGSLRATVPGALAAIRARSVRVQLGPTEALVLDVPDLLLHVALHTARHHRFFEAVLRLHDVACIVRRSAAGLDWDRIGDDARRLGTSGWLATTLAAAQLLFHVELPDGLWARWGVSEAPDLARAALPLAWSRWRTSANPESASMAASPVARWRGLATRLAAVVAHEGPTLEDRWLRLRLAAQVSAPAWWRALREGQFSGARADEMRRLGRASEALERALEAANARAAGSGDR
ncbi:MAG: nucleotidyltransferase family protein [Gemmatimonadetes bacterium]|nr:nucleotidyltransferase family protein [Gemmatimonadota bacterium]